MSCRYFHYLTEQAPLGFECTQATFSLALRFALPHQSVGAQDVSDGAGATKHTELAFEPLSAKAALASQPHQRAIDGR